jgi:5'-nucleotidase
LFSNGLPTQATVVVSAGDIPLGGPVAIDPTIVDTTDEQGRATVVITIPEGTPAGTLVLTVSVPETGTSIDVPIEITSTLEPIEVVKDPKITGNAKVGSTLKVNEGKWSVKNPEFSYQWNRDGVPIDGATGATYKVTAADAGTELTVTVTASADGYADGVATTEGKTVKKLDSDTRGSLNRILITQSAAVNYTVVVRAENGIVPTGAVRVFDGRELIATEVLDAGDNGRLTIKLEGFDRGIHAVTARFEGNGQIERSTAWPSLLLVW